MNAKTENGKCHGCGYKTKVKIIPMEHEGGSALQSGPMKFRGEARVCAICEEIMGVACAITYRDSNDPSTQHGASKEQRMICWGINYLADKILKSQVTNAGGEWSE